MVKEYRDRRIDPWYALWRVLWRWLWIQQRDLEGRGSLRLEGTPRRFAGLEKSFFFFDLFSMFDFDLLRDVIDLIK